jgi:hypothetical protein
VGGPSFCTDVGWRSELRLTAGRRRRAGELPPPRGRALGRDVLKSASRRAGTAISTEGCAAKGSASTFAPWGGRDIDFAPR